MFKWLNKFRKIKYPGFREVDKNEILPFGSIVKMDLATGKNYVKIVPTKELTHG